MSETEKLEGSGSEKRKYKYGSDAEKEIDDYGRKRDEEMRKEKHRSSEDEYRRSKKKRRRSRSSSNSSSSSRSSSSSSSSSEDDRRRTKSRSKSKDYSRGRKRESNYNDGNRENWYPQGFSQDQPTMGYQQNVQYTDGSYQQNYNSQNFRGGYNTYPEYDQGYYQGQNFQQPVTHEYSMGGPAMQGAGWDNNVYDVSRPSVGADAGKTDEAKKEAVEQELIQQKLTLSKQREEYIRKKSSLTRELNRLKEQKRELMAEDTKENERILRENSKLRSEIANKLKSMDSVIEMLSNIIGDKDNLHEVIEEIRKKDKKSEKKKHDESPKHKEKIKSRSRSPSLSDQGESKYNLVHYDPELHWCSECNVFPRTIVDYLNHLHSDEHKAAKSKLKLDEMPWHVDFPKESTPPFVKDTPYKRVPIRGVQFLVPSSAWYCSLCKEWLGDLILATKHLKMRLHAKKYKEFTSQNPDWEVDWLTERTKSYERTSSEAKKDKEDSVKEQPSSTMASLGDQLLAMIQNSKHQKDDDSKSSSSSESERESKHKGKKKKKKSKKKKSSKKKSPSPEPKKDFNSLYDDLIKSEKNTFESYYKNEFNGSDSKKEDKKSSDEESDAEPKQLDPDEIRKAFKDTKIVLNAERPYVYKVSKPAEEEPAKPSNPLPVSDEDSNEKNHSKVKKDKKKDSKKDRRDKHRDRDRDRDGDHRRDRDRDRDRDYGRYRDRSRSRDRRRRDREPPRRRYPKPKTPERKKKKGIEEEKEETVWEKRASELLKKKEVKKTSFTIPKTKLPFIGRMPVMKKKSEPKPEDNQEEGQEHRVLTLAEIKKMKSQEHFMTEVAKLHREQQIKAIRALHTLYHLSGQVPPFPLPPLDPEYFEVPKVQVREVVPETYGPILPPVVIDPVPVITPLDIPTPLEPPPADMPVPMIPIIPSQIQVAETDVVPPTLPVPMSEIETQPKPNDDNIEQDMEIEEEQQPPPVATPKSKEDLHEDFKEALDMLFPENGKPRPIIKPQKVEVKPPSPPPGTVTYDIAVMASKMGYDISMYTEQGQQYQAYYMQQQQQGSKFVKQYETGAKFPNKNYQGPEVGSIPNVEGIPPPSKQDEPLDIKPPEEKKKNPPSQRMRRHLKKLALKKAQQEEEAARMHEAQLLLEQSTNDENESTDTNQEGNANDDSQETPVQEMAVDPEPTLPPPDKKPFIPREMSELEMLGIEEGDFGAQNFA